MVREHFQTTAPDLPGEMFPKMVSFLFDGKHRRILQVFRSTGNTEERGKAARMLFTGLRQFDDRIVKEFGVTDLTKDKEYAEHMEFMIGLLQAGISRVHHGQHNNACIAAVHDDVKVRWGASCCTTC